MSGPEDWDIDKKIKKIGKIGLLKLKKSNLANWKLNSFVSNRGVIANQCSNAIFHNEDEFLLNQYITKKAYYARSFNKYIEKWGKSDKDLKKQFGISYRFLLVFIENGKWTKMLKSPHLAIGMFFLRFYVGFVYLYARFLKK